MKKNQVNWWIDPFMFPITLSAFLLGYIWQSFHAGWVSAEYVFDKQVFLNKYNNGKKL